MRPISTAAYTKPCGCSPRFRPGYRASRPRKVSRSETSGYPATCACGRLSTSLGRVSICWYSQTHHTSRLTQNSRPRRLRRPQNLPPRPLDTLPRIREPNHRIRALLLRRHELHRPTPGTHGAPHGHRQANHRLRRGFRARRDRHELLRQGARPLHHGDGPSGACLQPLQGGEQPGRVRDLQLSGLGARGIGILVWLSPIQALSALAEK